MRINHNIAALNTYNKLTANTAATSKSLEKLSSGLKINKAGDNAAGLAISEKMRGQIRGLDQASTNASDAISLINTAEGALSETHSILQRMRELAVQSSNDTNVTIDREEIQKEMNQLTSEINRIGNTTEFNTQKLLDGGGSKVTSGSVISTITGGKAGAVTNISTKAASATGKATTEIQFTNTAGTATYKLSIAAKDSGTTLNGYNFAFTDNNAYSGLSGTATLSSNTVTIDANLNTLTAAGLEAILNTQGLAANPVTVTLVDSGGDTSALAFAASGAASLTGKSTVAMNGGSSNSTRGVYSFDIAEAFVTDADEFTIRIQGSGGKVGTYTDITLTASSGNATAALDFAIGTEGARYTKEQQATTIATALNLSNSFNAAYTATSNGSTITITEKADKISGTAVELTDQSSTKVNGEMTYTHSQKNIVQAGGKFTIDGVDILVIDPSDADKYATEISQGGAITYSGTVETVSGQMEKLVAAIKSNATLAQKYSAKQVTALGVETSGGTLLELTQTDSNLSSNIATISMSDKTGSGFSAAFQIGANTAQSMTIDVNDMRSAALEVAGKKAGGEVQAKNGSIASYTETKDVSNGTTNAGVEYALDVSTHKKATAAISVINDAIESVSAERSKLGSYQNRLEHTINNLGTSSENLTTAESRIRDVDMAKEMMEFTKNNILSQAAQSMLAQANQQPQGVLQLLQ